MLKKGFTIVEIIVVVGIIAVLVAIAPGAGYSAKKVGRDNQRITSIQLLQLKLEAYHAQYGNYPSSLDGLVNPIAFLSELPKDPLTGQDYHYVQLGLSSASCGVSYHLGANLETNHSALQRRAGGIGVLYACSSDFPLNPDDRKTYDVLSPDAFKR